MTKFTVNPTRLDPYKNFKFRLKLDGRYVAGANQASGLMSHDDTAKTPGRSKYEPITLESGVTHDSDFQQWASSGLSGVIKAANQPLTKNLMLEVYDEAGNLTMAYAIRGASVVDYQPMPKLDGSSNAVAIQAMKLANEGWECDRSVSEAKEL
jgi:phage tail-like protein